MGEIRNFCTVQGGADRFAHWNCEETITDESASFFLAAPAIKKYETAIAIPTISKEPMFDIDENGDLCQPEQSAHSL